MEKPLSVKMSESMEGFHQEKIDYSIYESSFRRWLVCEIESKRISFFEAKDRFKFPDHFTREYKKWQKIYSEDIQVSLSLMTAKERTKVESLESRIKDLEKELEHSQKKLIAMNVLVDIAENEYKIPIRKKSGPKQS